MAGEALTSKFMLGTATLMIGAQADGLNLGVAQSLGLVKNVALTTTPGFTELTQGVKNNLVASVQTSNDMTVDAEMYEYTAKNMTYAVSLDGSQVTTPAGSTTVATAMTTSGGPPALTSTTMSLTSATGFTVGKFVMIHVNAADQIFIRKITAVSTNDVTLNAGLPVSVPQGAKVEVVNMVPLGSTKDNPYLSAKIVGQLADLSWVTILLPKVRVTSGISMGFRTENFDNIPLQLKVYDLTTTDANYSYFQEADGSVAKAHIYPGGLGS